MKSKTFCFNASIIRKNIVLYWPIWAGYLIVLLACVPIRLWMKLNAYVNYYMVNVTPREYKSALMYYVNSVCSVDLLSIIALIMAVATVMALSSYLFSARSSNMMHAFPVSRAELFHTTVISALGFMLIPELIAFLATVLVCLAYGITCVEYVAILYLVLAMASVLFLSMGMLAAMLTGQLVAVPVIVGVMNYAYVFLRSILGDVLCLLSYGMTGYSMYSDQYFLLCSPLAYFMRWVKFRLNYVTEGTQEYVTGMKTEGVPIIGWYCLVAVLFLVIAYILYQKRPLEKAGDVVSFAKFAPVFRWLAGFVIGYAAIMYLSMFLEQARIFLPKPMIAGLTLVVGILSFYLVDMLIQKSFRVLNKKILKESALFLASMLLSFVALFAVSEYEEAYVPEQDKIASAKFNMSYEIEMKGADVAKIMDIQKEFIAHADEWIDKARESAEYTNVGITYSLTNGKSVYRNYMIPHTDSGLVSIGKLCDFERDPELFVKGYLCNYFENPGRVTGSFDCNYSDYESFGQQDADVLLTAIKMDAQEGSIQKYNMISENGIWSYDESTRYCGYLNFNFPNKEPKVLYDNYFGEYTETQTYCSISFGTDCKHLIEALIDTGLIQSPDDLMLYSEYSAMNAEIQ